MLSAGTFSLPITPSTPRSDVLLLNGGLHCIFFYIKAKGMLSVFVVIAIKIFCSYLFFVTSIKTKVS